MGNPTITEGSWARAPAPRVPRRGGRQHGQAEQAGDGSRCVAFAAVRAGAVALSRARSAPEHGRPRLGREERTMSRSPYAGRRSSLSCRSCPSPHCWQIEGLRAP
jgi:hypothetical protein